MSDKELLKEYFRHDYGARTDTRKMRKFVRKFGMRGYGLFWSMAEMLYKEGGYIPLRESENIADDLDVDTQEVKDAIEYMFHTDGEKFWSNTVFERLAERASKSDKARDASYAGWKKRKGDEYEPPENVEAWDIGELDITEANELWEKVKEKLKSQVSRSNYRTWIEKTVGISINGKEFYVGVPNVFVAEYLDKNQRSLIEKALISEVGNEVKAVFKIVKGMKEEATGSS